VCCKRVKKPTQRKTANSFMDSIKITPATAEDCAACARLLAGQLDEHQIQAPLERLQAVLDRLVKNPERGFVLVARDAAEIVGLAYVAVILSVEHCGPVAWLEELYVAPEGRNRGVGTALLQGVIERSRQDGIEAIDLEIDEGHDRVASLYERFGFRPLRRSRWVRK
jgi:GNAT superfamily N-acetyltransferase